ncbi:YqhA family protein [bacterium]|nr:YqhA family protein [bacterium]
MKKTKNGGAHPHSKIELWLENGLFWSRWLHVVFYVGLGVVQVGMMTYFVKDLLKIFSEILHFDGEQLILAVLGLVDVVLVAQLTYMVTLGGYTTMVSHLDIKDRHPDKPKWLAHISPTTLKTKLAQSLIGISGVGLLRAFFELDKLQPNHVWMRLAIHGLFVFSALALGLLEKMSDDGDEKHHRDGGDSPPQGEKEPYLPHSG